MPLPIIGTAINGFKDIVGLFKLPPEEKLKADLQLAQLQTQLQSELMDYQKTLLTEGASTVRAEVASQSWMARTGARSRC